MRRGDEGSTLVRVLTALVVIPVALGLIWTPWLWPGFVAFVLVLAFLGLREFYAMARARGVLVTEPAGLAAGAAMILAGALGGGAWLHLALFGGLALTVAAHLRPDHQSLLGLAATVFGVFYVGWLPAHFVMLQRLPEHGPALVTLLAVAVVWSDTGAYFAGRALGRHKMAPKLSPKKTWEGAVGGLVAAMAALAVLWAIGRQWPVLGFPDWPIGGYLAAGAALAVAAQVGDLLESMLKRDAGVKDSGTLFPGHGGVLDRCDGLIVASPLLYYWLTL